VQGSGGSLHAKAATSFPTHEEDVSRLDTENVSPLQNQIPTIEVPNIEVVQNGGDTANITNGNSDSYGCSQAGKDCCSGLQCLASAMSSQHHHDHDRYGHGHDNHHHHHHDQDDRAMAECIHFCGTEVVPGVISCCSTVGHVVGPIINEILKEISD
jgi:hypothetical protein